MIPVGLSRRRRRVPSDAPLGRRERALAAGGAAGVRAVASDAALLVDAGAGWERLPWWEVLSARWDADASVLHVQTADTVLALPLDPPGALPETVRERVRASIVLSRHVSVRGPLGATLVARRVPGEDQPVWQQLLDPGLDASDPHVLDTLSREIAQLRSYAV